MPLPIVEFRTARRSRFRYLRIVAVRMFAKSGFCDARRRRPASGTTQSPSSRAAVAAGQRDDAASPSSRAAGAGARRKRRSTSAPWAGAGGGGASGAIRLAGIRGRLTGAGLAAQTGSWVVDSVESPRHFSARGCADEKDDRHRSCVVFCVRSSLTCAFLRDDGSC